MTLRHLTPNWNRVVPLVYLWVAVPAPLYIWAVLHFVMQNG